MIRLNKFISDSGFCSRREADKLIEQGEVFINGKQCETGQQIHGHENVEVQGLRIKPRTKKETVYIALNKPEGVTCTTEGNVKGNIIDFVNYPEKIFPIGRLDKFSQGLIFLTNDGDIVNKILRAGNAHEKEYNVSVNKAVSDDFLRKMAKGVPILNTVTEKCKVSRLGRNTFKIILTQGLNRQIRRMCEFLGYRVTFLQRSRIMNVELGKLKTGTWRYLNPDEMAQINEMIANSSNTQEASKDPNRRKPTPHSKARPYQKKEYSKTKRSDKGKGPKSRSKKDQTKSSRTRKRR